MYLEIYLSRIHPQFCPKSQLQPFGQIQWLNVITITKFIYLSARLYAFNDRFEVGAVFIIFITNKKTKRRNSTLAIATNIEL